MTFCFGSHEKDKTHGAERDGTGWDACVTACPGVALAVVDDVHHRLDYSSSDSTVCV